MARLRIECRACGAILSSRKALTEHGKQVHPLHRGKRMAQTKKSARIRLNKLRREP
jgi:hypothetical protein